jgi:tetraacyldisaccharide 4'-kinase
VVGGTGKTPVTIALAKALGERGLKVGVVCSAYRARDGAAHMVCAGSNAAHVGDEAVLLARATGVPVAAGRSRAAALSLLLARAGKLDVVLSDDGLQHLGLARTVEIGVFDERGLGNGRVLPAGPLREPATVASELDALLLNGTDRLPCVHPRHWRFEIEPGGFHQLASGQTLTAASFVAAHRTAGRILAMAGIARPERFFSILRAFGLEVTGQALTDHARIHPSWLASADADLILLTDKDAVKWPDCADPRCWSLSVQARLPAPFIDWLLERLNGPATA